VHSRRGTAAGFKFFYETSLILEYFEFSLFESVNTKSTPGDVY
jgi:hypothetical protein